MSSQAQADRRSSPRETEPDGQRRVDAIVAEAKRGAWRPRPASPPSPPPAMPPKLIEQRLAEELEYVQRLLEKTGDQLAGDPAILQSHMRTMQGFDLMGQIVGHIAKVVAAEDKGAAVDAIGMHELRTRLKRQASAALGNDRDDATD